MKLLFIPFLILFASCDTTTMTYPDGRVAKTSSQNPAVVAALASGITNGIIQGGTAYLESRKGSAK